MKVVVLRRGNEIIIRRPATREQDRMEVVLDMNEVTELQDRLNEIMRESNAG